MATELLSISVVDTDQAGHRRNSQAAAGGIPRGDIAHSMVEPASPNIPRPRDRSRMSTTRANGPGSSGGPGLWLCGPSRHERALLPSPPY